MSEFLIIIYDYALIALQWLGGGIGKMELGYFVVNIALFVFVQPILIIAFFVLWLRQKRKNRLLQKSYHQNQVDKNV